MAATGPGRLDPGHHGEAALPRRPPAQGGQIRGATMLSSPAMAASGRIRATTAFLAGHGGHRLQGDRIRATAVLGGGGANHGGRIWPPPPARSS